MRGVMTLALHFGLLLKLINITQRETWAARGGPEQHTGRTLSDGAGRGSEPLFDEVANVAGVGHTEARRH